MSALSVHPHDPGLLIGGIGALRDWPADVDAVVSLCRLGPDDVVPNGVEHIDVRLVDRPEPDQNPNLGFVLHDTIELLHQLRRQHKTVLLHCVAAHSRTPMVAALYGSALAHVSFAQALRAVQDVLPAADPNPGFRKYAEKLFEEDTFSLVDAWRSDQIDSGCSMDGDPHLIVHSLAGNPASWTLDFGRDEEPRHLGIGYRYVGYTKVLGSHWLPEGTVRVSTPTGQWIELRTDITIPVLIGHGESRFGDDEA